MSIHKKMQHYVDAGFPILYLETFEEMKADELIAAVAASAQRNVIEWDIANGLREWSFRDGTLAKSPREVGAADLEPVLHVLNDPEELAGCILVIKDGCHFFESPRVLGLLKDIALKILSGADATVMIVSPVVLTPPELEKHITVLEMGHLDSGQIRDMIRDFAEEHQLTVAPSMVEEMTTAFKGLTEYEICNILALAYAAEGSLSRTSLKLIHEQKQQTIRKSGILEMIEFQEGLDDIGGLENLKQWLQQKAAIFRDLDRAFAFGVEMPKGVLIAGVPGCGKSLNAKAAAKLFHVPLLRLDMGRLLGKYVGDSEANMRKAIALAEAISPCVLWIDELEKAFAGIGDNGGGAEVTTRLFGHFLTWMQEKKSAVFVVATANDILKLPPELMRKGRFDEIFYVGLPSDAERKKIFEIHIAKRRKADLPAIDIDKLASRTKGYSGADIEGIVKDSVEAVFAAGKSALTTNDILQAMENTHSISEMMKESIEKLSREYEMRKFKSASK